MKLCAINFYKHISVFAILFFLNNTINAQITSIPDSAFEQYLIDDGIDSDATLNGQVLESDISGLTAINIIGYDISNFEGLQYFTSLLNFTLINNQASTINNIDFSGNLFLTQIDIINIPNLPDINVDSNIDLISLTVVTNGTLFNSIIVSNNTNLETLTLANNGLTEINTENNLALTYLSIGDNPFTSIDISHLEFLETFNAYETQIEILDVSNNYNLQYMSCHTAAFSGINLNNGNIYNFQSVDLSNNPNLGCILVEDVAYAETATGWQKDVTATYIDESISIITQAQDDNIQYDSSGNYQIDIDEWLANNGGASANSDCGQISWSKNINHFVHEDSNTIIYEVDFSATDVFGNKVYTFGTLFVENINHFVDEIYGTGDTICDDVFDLNTVITNIDATASLNASDISSFSFARIPNGESNEGPAGASFDDTKVDFPDTGAGSFSYLFKVSVEKTLAVYNPTSGGFEENTISDDANITLNDKTVAFETEELDDITVSPGTITSMQYLTDLLVITPDPDVLEPQNPIDLNQYWTPSEYTGAGTYTFDPTNAFPNCPSNAVSITVTEETLSLEDSELHKLSIYPNPTTSNIFIKGNTQAIKNIEIFTITGQQLLHFEKDLNEINIRSLKSGIYFVKLKGVNAFKTIKLIKN